MVRQFLKLQPNVIFSLIAADAPLRWPSAERALCLISGTRGASARRGRDRVGTLAGGWL